MLNRLDERAASYLAPFSAELQYNADIKEALPYLRNHGTVLVRDGRDIVGLLQSYDLIPYYTARPNREDLHIRSYMCRSFAVLDASHELADMHAVLERFYDAEQNKASLRVVIVFGQGGMLGYISHQELLRWHDSDLGVEAPIIVFAPNENAIPRVLIDEHTRTFPTIKFDASRLGTIESRDNILALVAAELAQKYSIAAEVIEHFDTEQPVLTQLRWVAVAKSDEISKGNLQWLNVLDEQVSRNFIGYEDILESIEIRDRILLE